MQSFSTKTDKKNALRLSHYPYYRDRATEYELCRDFPTDEILIDGLYSMQTHFDNNGVQISIPIVRVMNAAHYIAAYMFSNNCAGDQLEYEALAAMSVGRDRQLAKVIMIVLAAMLLRTEGFRARQCRSVILENRDPDFEEGVTLYDRFLRSAERRFSMEDFLTDIPALVEQNQQLQIENNRLTTEISQLKFTITTMEEKYQQINIGSQTFIGSMTKIGTVNFNISGAGVPTDIPHFTTAPSPEPQIELFRFIHPSITDDNERLQIHREIENLVRTLPLPEICRYLMEMRKNCRVYLSVKPELMFEELHRMGMPDETTPGYSMKNFRSYFNVNN